MNHIDPFQLLNFFAPPKKKRHAYKYASRASIVAELIITESIFHIAQAFKV